MCKTGMRLDFQGVILLMWGATVPLIYYGFYCSGTLQKVYWTLVSALTFTGNISPDTNHQLSTLAIACSVFTFQPRFSDPYLRPLRAATFGCLAVSNIVPIVHGILRYGFALQVQRMGLKYVLATLVLNTTGATAYAVKVSRCLDYILSLLQKC